MLQDHDAYYWDKTPLGFLTTDFGLLLRHYLRQFQLFEYYKKGYLVYEEWNLYSILLTLY